MIDVLTVLVLVCIFVGLGFALGWAWCDKKTTDEFIDHVSRYNLMSGTYKIVEDNPNEEQSLI